MFRRGVKAPGWSWDRAVRHTVACFATDVEKLEARAAIVLRVDPKDVPTMWVEEAQAMGEALPAYFAVCYAHEGVDEARLLLDGDRQALVHERRGTSTRIAEPTRRERGRRRADRFARTSAFRPLNLGYCIDPGTISTENLKRMAAE